MNIQAKVAVEKEKHPERFCPVKRCLWKTAKLDHATQTYSGGGYSTVMEWIRNGFQFPKAGRAAVPSTDAPLTKSASEGGQHGFE